VGRRAWLAGRHTNNGLGDAMGGNVQPRRNAAGKVSGHVPSVGPILLLNL